MAVSIVADTIYTYRFLKLLVTPFRKTEAYNLGIIDETGKRIKDKKLSDEALLRSYKEKPSLEIIGEYYQRYGHLVMGTSMKYLKNKFDAEDLVMHLFENNSIKILC